jgi:hypothetical protein
MHLPLPYRPVLPIAAFAALLLPAPALTSIAHADEPLHQRIDQEIAAKVPGFLSKAAPPAGDEEFLRRLYLDLTGNIPTTQQALEFLQDKAPDRRARLIDRLLASPEYARHMQHVFDVLWMERRPDKNVPSAAWQEFLRSSFAANKPYNQLVGEVLSANGTDPKTRPAAKFYLDRQGEPHLLTKDVSRLFLGMNLQCAQCHDHPLVNAYKQDHYYGLYAFFSRSYLFTDTKLKQVILAEKAEGDVSFQSVFKPKVSRQTGPRLPDGALLKEPTFPKGKEYKAAPTKTQGGIPEFSRRDQLAGLLAGPDNPRFRRAAANRFWALMMGRGLIEPVDFDHPDNPPSHPRLLDLLADELATMKFDVKGFLRELALSETYQRSSQMPRGKELPPENTFAVAQVRPLSPEQLAWSVMQATGLLDAERKALGAKATEPTLYARLAKNAVPFAKTFGGEAGDPADLGFQATLDQSLFVRNGPLIRSWLAPRAGNLTQRLLQTKDTDAIIDELFVSVLTRRPTMEERDEIRRFLARHSGSDRTEAVQELAWALLASAEFRFNH